MEDQPGHYSPPAATLTDPLRPAVPPGVGRRILGVLVGGIGVDLVLGLTVATVGTVIVVLMLGGDEATAATPARLTSSVLGLTFSVLGGYTAAYIAPWRPALIGGMAGMVSLLVSSPIMLLVPDGGWGALEIATATLHLPLAVWGGHLARNARS